MENFQANLNSQISFCIPSKTQTFMENVMDNHWIDLIESKLYCVEMNFDLDNYFPTTSIFCF